MAGLRHSWQQVRSVKQTVVTKLAGGVACSVNLQLSQKRAAIGCCQNVSAHSNGAGLFALACPICSACLLTYIY